MSEIKSFKDLLVWQKSVVLVTEVYKFTKHFPKDESFGLTSQLRRCAVSIPSNVAEGFGRRSSGDYIRFLNIAVGSLYELQTQLVIANNLEYIDTKKFNDVNEMAMELDRMFGSLVRKLK